MTHASKAHNVAVDHLLTMSKDMSQNNADETLKKMDVSLQAIVDAFERSPKIEDLAEHVLEDVYALARALTAGAEANDVKDARSKLSTSMSAFEAGLTSGSPKASAPDFIVSGAS